MQRKRGQMGNGAVRIDLVKLIKYLLKRIWLVILFAAAGFAAMYYYTNRNAVDTYTASGTMYVYNSNPNMVNYQYTSTTDLNSAVQLIDTYMVVVKSNKVMDVVAERLSKDYEEIPTAFIASTLSMSSVAQTGVVRVSSTTTDPQLSADIVNAVLDVAPAEIIRVVGAGGIEIIDYAETPFMANSRGTLRMGAIGAMAGCMFSVGLLLVLFLMNQHITDIKDLEGNYTPPVLASLKRNRKNNQDPSAFLLTQQSEMEMIESYAKLRMNLLYTLVGKENHIVVFTSAISGEGKSTIVANLAISCAMSGKKVLLVDADLRRACQRDIFGYNTQSKGVSEILVGDCVWQDVVLKDTRESLDILPAGELPPNPAELLESEEMKTLLKELGEAYELVLLDMPPVNIVSDPMVLSAQVAGCLFVVRQNYSDHRDIRKALISAEMTGMDVMGFIFYGEKINQESGHRKKTYQSYYNKYDYRKR